LGNLPYVFGQNYVQGRNDTNGPDMTRSPFDRLRANGKKYIFKVMIWAEVGIGA